MSKEAGSSKTSGAKQVSQKAFSLTLDEFCRRLSLEDRRVELIGAFYASEKKARRIKDTEAGFRSRYEAFTRKRPV